MIITLGAEVEYATKPGTNCHRILPIDTLELELEFYPHMVEFNKILIPSKLDPEYLEESLQIISKIIKEKAIQIKELLNLNDKRNWRVYISPIPFEKYNGLIWNGFHLHIGGHIPPEKLKWFKAFAIYWKYKNNWDLRVRTSHHIWGKHRISNYNFKNKSKFSPVINTTHNTTEFRIFSADDIILRRLRKKLAIFIYHLITSHKRHTNTREFVESFCNAMNWDKDDIRELWRMEVERPAEYIPRDEERLQKLGRLYLYEKICGQEYQSRSFFVTNIENAPKVVRKLIELNVGGN